MPLKNRAPEGARFAPNYNNQSGFWAARRATLSVKPGRRRRPGGRSRRPPAPERVVSAGLQWPETTWEAPCAAKSRAGSAAGGRAERRVGAWYERRRFPTAFLAGQATAPACAAPGIVARVPGARALAGSCKPREPANSTPAVARSRLHRDLPSRKCARRLRGSATLSGLPDSRIWRRAERRTSDCRQRVPTCSAQLQIPRQRTTSSGRPFQPILPEARKWPTIAGPNTSMGGPPP